MVTSDNLFLEGALLVYDNIDPMKVSPAEYAAKPSIADGMDVVIFDDYTPDALPPPPASLLFFHPTGEHSPVRDPRRGADPAHHRGRRGPPGDALGHDDRRLHGQERACSRPTPKKGESTRRVLGHRSDHRREARWPPQDPRVRVLAAGERPRQRDRSADARRVPDAARQHARLVRRRSGRPPDHLRDRPARARPARRRRRRDRGRGQGSRRHDHAHAGDRRARHVLRPQVGYYDLTAKAQTASRSRQIELAANLASASESDIAPSTLAHARRQEARGARGVRDHPQPEAVDLSAPARDGARSSSSGSPITGGSRSDDRNAAGSARCSRPAR